MANTYNYEEILRSELIPALGCTEPIAIAYAAAKARSVLGAFPEKLELYCSGNVVKNVKGVNVPNAGGLKGIDVAGVLGTVCGNAEQELQVLTQATAADVEKTKRLIQEGFVTCHLVEGVENLYIHAIVSAGGHSAEVTIANKHTFITDINNRDYPVVMGITMFSCTILLLGNFLADILYGFADPRIKVGKE